MIWVNERHGFLNQRSYDLTGSLFPVPISWPKCVMMTSSNGNIFPHYWPFVREIRRTPVNSPHKGQWRGALMFSLICAWINCWVNNRQAGDLRHHHAHYDVIVMFNTFIRPTAKGISKHNITGQLWGELAMTYSVGAHWHINLLRTEFYWINMNMYLHLKLIVAGYCDLTLVQVLAWWWI